MVLWEDIANIFFVELAMKVFVLFLHGIEFHLFLIEHSVDSLQLVTQFSQGSGVGISFGMR